MNTVETLDELKEIINNNSVVVVDLYADWCRPCQEMMPVIEELSTEVSIPFVKVNIDLVPEVKEFTGAKAIPMILIYKDGIKREFVFGVNPKEKVKGKIDRALRY